MSNILKKITLCKKCRLSLISFSIKMSLFALQPIIHFHLNVGFLGIFLVSRSIFFVSFASKDFLHPDIRFSGCFKSGYCCENTDLFGVSSFSHLRQSSFNIYIRMSYSLMIVSHFDFGTHHRVPLPFVELDFLFGF